MQQHCTVCTVCTVHQSSSTRRRAAIIASWHHGAWAGRCLVRLGPGSGMVDATGTKARSCPFTHAGRHSIACSRSYSLLTCPHLTLGPLILPPHSTPSSCRHLDLSKNLFGPSVGALHTGRGRGGVVVGSTAADRPPALPMPAPALLQAPRWGQCSPGTALWRAWS